MDGHMTNHTHQSQVCVYLSHTDIYAIAYIYLCVTDQIFHIPATYTYVLELEHW